MCPMGFTAVTVADQVDIMRERPSYSHECVVFGHETHLLFHEK